MEYLPLFLATIVLATTVCGGLSTTPDTSCVLANVTKNLILQRSVVTNRVNTSELWFLPNAPQYAANKVNLNLLTALLDLLMQRQRLEQLPASNVKTTLTAVMDDVVVDACSYLRENLPTDFNCTSQEHVQGLLNQIRVRNIVDDAVRKHGKEIFQALSNSDGDCNTSTNSEARETYWRRLFDSEDLDSSQRALVDLAYQELIRRPTF